MDDDENLHQEGYFTAFATVTDELDPKAADFEWVFNNIRIGIRHSPYLRLLEKQQLRQMLHIMLVSRRHEVSLCAHSNSLKLS